MLQQKSRQSGFSLVELLVAVVILAVGLLGLAELQVTAIKANSQSETILAASSLAQQVIEEVAAMNSDDPIFDTVVTAPDQVWTGSAVSPSSLISPVTVTGGGSYNIFYTADPDYEGVSNLCYIVVTVTSTQAVLNVTGNRQRTVKVSTLKRSS